MEPQKTQNCQSNPEGKNKARDFREFLQSYSNQNSMVLVQKQMYRSMEQSRRPRNKPMHLWSINLQQWRQEYTME